jgi:hypothetical protein
MLKCADTVTQEGREKMAKVIDFVTYLENLSPLLEQQLITLVAINPSMKYAFDYETYLALNELDELDKLKLSNNFPQLVIH